MRDTKPPVRLRLFAACMLCMGCGGVNYYPVEGTVRYKNGKDHKALVGAAVILEPVDRKIRSGVRGVIKEDGRFVMGREKEGDGAEAGIYKVLVLPPPPPSVDRPRPGRPVLKLSYQRTDQTPLEFTVEAKPNRWDIEVE